MSESQKDVNSGRWTGRAIDNELANAAKRPINWVGGGIAGAVSAAAASGHWFVSLAIMGVVLAIWLVSGRNSGEVR
jgi:hypothetical protein